MIPALLFLYAFGGTHGATAATADERLHTIASGKAWLRLLHYENRWLSADRSEAEGKLFFLAPNGRDEPLAELQADLKAFRDPNSGLADLSTEKPLDEEIILKLHPLCRFPARARYLEKELGETFPKVACAHLEQFLRILSPHSVSLVFSSFFLGGPSSTFGHTLLRINNQRAMDQSGRHHELLDFGVNFAARVTVDNPLLYAIYGLTGLFPGEFTNVPYYYKVREYHDFESRDLWSYDLNLTPEEVIAVTNHVWELSSTWFRYFYFTRNCSYHMFTILDAAAPRLNLTETVPYYVIPSDTVRALYRYPGLVKSIQYRPSALTQFTERKKDLSPKEEGLLKEIVRKKQTFFEKPVVSDFSRESLARVYDSALDFVEFQSPSEILKPETDAARFKQSLSINRARLGIIAPEFNMSPPPERQTHLSHGIRRVGLKTGYTDLRGGFKQLSYRFALHDPLDPEMGYPESAQIEFMHLKARYQFRQKQFEWEDLRLFKVLSLDPIDAFRSPLSYRVELGMRRATHSNCRAGPNETSPACLMGALNVAMGWASKLSQGEGWLTGYAMSSSEFSFSSDYTGSPIKVGVGPRSGVILRLGKDFLAEGSVFYHWLAFAQNSADFEQQLQLRKAWNQQLGADLSWRRQQNTATSNEWALQLLYYF